jgi:hypothetical protein
MTTFTVTYPIDSTPLIMRNTTSTGSAQTVSVRNQGTVTDWYWNRGANQFNANTTNTVLTSTEFVAILYSGQYPLLSLMDNAAAIAERAAVEGGSGRYESVVNDQTADTDTLAILEANGLLAQYGNIKQDLDFVTTKFPVFVGDLLTVAVPELALNGNFLATNVRVKNWRLADREYMVTATNGQYRGDFTEFFRTLSNQGPQPSQTNVVVSRPIAHMEALAFTDSIIANSSSTMVSVWGLALAGQSEWSG